MHIKWGPETDRLALMAVIALNPSIKWNDAGVAKALGTTKDSVGHRFRVLKKEIAAIGDSDGDEAPLFNNISPKTDAKAVPAGRKRKNSTQEEKDASGEPSPKKVRKHVSPPKKARGRKGAAGRSAASKLSDEDDTDPGTPDLSEDDGQERSSPIEPATPSKVLPSRKVKREPGSYKELDNGSEVAFAPEEEELEE